MLAEDFPVVARFEQETLTGLDQAERTRRNDALHRVLRNAVAAGGTATRAEA